MRYPKMVILFILFILSGPALADRGRDYIQVREVTMSLQDGDAVFDVRFELDAFAKIYVLALGTKYIEPELMDLFSDFDNVTVRKSGPNMAVLVSEAAGDLRSGYYLYDSRDLGKEIPKLTVVYPGRLSRTFYRVSATPSVFSEA
ncbi:hypothetical protein [Candidatus Methanocrinis natronophilus]|uniref:AMIN domain-containing protein n=1 Tax=Candidatus Methanocrinis natronophilus TaxID=3033396 RepID=A0ABT5X4X0_9EURY|nr:hypothetical protein [Candidatus Methanocrinis natronophilus]MDF0589744.1 hypothetical protein [Candidatus Methanocrinis natronophilus]